MGFLGEVRDSIFNAKICFKSNEIFNFSKNYQGSLGCLGENFEISKIVSNFGRASGASEKFLVCTSQKSLERPKIPLKIFQNFELGGGWATPLTPPRYGPVNRIG